MRDLIIVLAPQEYVNANHKILWKYLTHNNETQVLVLDIPADYVITFIKGKQYRLRENREGLTKICGALNKYRPIFPLRPEITPDCFGFIIRKLLKKQIEQFYDLVDYKVSFIVYNPKWVRILKGFSENIKIYYYILDELRLYAHNDRKIRRNVADDYFACSNSDHIFAMSEGIKRSRNEFADKITVVGNGAVLSIQENKVVKIPNSVGFIGNFRNWIDEELLIELIEERKDLLFCFVGPIEENMKGFLRGVLTANINTAYFGVSTKEDVISYYRMFEVVIVPYKQTDFMKSTRPIKIVESIFAGTPVVTVPVSGYAENNFIKFATNHKEFSEKIDLLIENPIDTGDIEYVKFTEGNSWIRKSEIIRGIIL